VPIRKRETNPAPVRCFTVFSKGSTEANAHGIIGAESTRHGRAYWDSESQTDAVPGQSRTEGSTEQDEWLPGMYIGHTRKRMIWPWLRLSHLIAGDLGRAHQWRCSGTHSSLPSPPSFSFLRPPSWPVRRLVHGWVDSLQLQGSAHSSTESSSTTRTSSDGRNRTETSSYSAHFPSLSGVCRHMSKLLIGGNCIAISVVQSTIASMWWTISVPSQVRSPSSHLLIPPHTLPRIHPIPMAPASPKTRPQTILPPSCSSEALVEQSSAAPSRRHSPSLHLYLTILVCTRWRPLRPPAQRQEQGGV
jgi:hypothetical protein